MKRYIWLVSYLVKDENGDVAGYKTAFEAPDPIMACMQAGEFLKRNNDISLLADIMGHSGVNTTMIYTRRSGEEQKRDFDETVNW